MDIKDVTKEAIESSSADNIKPEEMNRKIADLANAAAEISQKEQEAEQKKRIPGLEEDIERLKELNLLKEAGIKLHFGKNPNKEIDDLLDRRMQLNRSDFRAFYLNRALISVFIVLFSLIFIFLIVAFLAYVLGCQNYISDISYFFSIITACLCAIVFFQPLPILDENRLKIHLSNMLNELETEKEKNEQKKTSI